MATSPMFPQSFTQPLYSQLDGLPELLSNCDYICNILPQTAETKGLLDGDILSHCRKKASSLEGSR